MSLYTPFSFIKQPSAEGGYRYWNYYVGSSVAIHHPRCSRIEFVDALGNPTTILYFVPDNCSDQGGFPTAPGDNLVDLGAGNEKMFVNVQFYATYTLSRRASNVDIQYSEDGITYTSLFTGIADSDANPSSPRCGLHTVLP